MKKLLLIVALSLCTLTSFATHNIVESEPMATQVGPDGYMGEIRLFAFDFVPRGWMRCEGQLLSISQYTALYSLLGYRYGEDGRNIFGLPNLESPLRNTSSDGRQSIPLGTYGISSVGDFPSSGTNNDVVASEFAGVRSEANSYLGEIKLFPYGSDGFIPKGWMKCDGQLLSISEHQALASLLGTNYGGDGITNFALPNLATPLRSPAIEGREQKALGSYCICVWGPYPSRN